MDLIPSIAFALFALLVMLIVISALIAGKSLAPWIPSNRAMVRQALRYISPNSNMTFADLGAGDGRIAILANKEFGMKAYGFEISLFPYALSRIRTLWHTNSQVRIERRDLFTVPLEKFDVIYIYGLPDQLNRKLAPKLAREVRSGARVISYNFSLKNKKPAMTYRNRWRTIYIYNF